MGGFLVYIYVCAQLTPCLKPRTTHIASMGTSFADEPPCAELGLPHFCMDVEDDEGDLVHMGRGARTETFLVMYNLMNHIHIQAYSYIYICLYISDI